MTNARKIYIFTFAIMMFFPYFNFYIFNVFKWTLFL